MQVAPAHKLGSCFADLPRQPAHAAATLSEHLEATNQPALAACDTFDPSDSTVPAFSTYLRRVNLASRACKTLHARPACTRATPCVLLAAIKRRSVDAPRLIDLLA
jgi:hypothetical protein